LDIHFVAVNKAFYSLLFPRCLRPALAALRAHGFRPLAADGAIETWTDSP
jgi:hypothetical protein